MIAIGEYEDDAIPTVIANNSTWSDGDWTGDREFTSADLTLAFEFGYQLRLGDSGYSGLPIDRQQDVAKIFQEVNKAGMQLNSLANFFKLSDDQLRQLVNPK